MVFSSVLVLLGDSPSLFFMRSPTWSYFLCSLLATSPIWASPAAPPLLIQTSIGTFQGFANATAGFEAWLGVPYAQPPVGKLRFKAPVSITRPFKGVQDATSFGDACPQPVSFASARRPMLTLIIH